MENNYNCIYRMIFPNGKSYVGQATNLKNRIHHHTAFARAKKDDCPKLCRALRKYNFDFSVEILAENIDSVMDRNELEKYFIREFNCISNGYNVTQGGESCIDPMTGKHVRYNSGTIKRDERGVYDYNKARSKIDDEYRKYLNECHSEWNKKHPESLRKAQKKWRETHPEHGKQYAQNNVEKMKNNARNWRMKNREHCNEYARRWRKEHEVKSPINRNRVKLDLNIMFSTVPNKDAFYRIFRDMFAGGRTFGKHFVFPRRKIGYLNEWGNWLYE